MFSKVYLLPANIFSKKNNFHLNIFTNSAAKWVIVYVFKYGDPVCKTFIV